MLRLVLLLILLIPNTSESGSRSFTQAELCELANWVVIGTVESRQSMWLDEARTTIVTQVTLSVDHVIAGDPERSVELVTLGGTIGGATQHVGEEPAMPVGSQHLLLLRKPPGSPPLLIGGTFGARRLDPAAPSPTPQERRAEWELVCAEHLECPPDTPL